MAQFSIRPARPEDCGTILELISFKLIFEFLFFFFN